ncbi:hypothetical protein BSLG_002085 [Batrachochytrium salamandrivorans]|nr:hypothetical protein BSLG_002085 [Batrachochytrium salamandrivorans]
MCAFQSFTTDFCQSSNLHAQMTTAMESYPFPSLSYTMPYSLSSSADLERSHTDSDTTPANSSEMPYLHSLNGTGNTEQHASDSIPSTPCTTTATDSTSNVTADLLTQNNGMQHRSASTDIPTTTNKETERKSKYSSDAITLKSRNVNSTDTQVRTLTRRAFPSVSLLVRVLLRNFQYNSKRGRLASHNVISSTLSPSPPATPRLDPDAPAVAQEIKLQAANRRQRIMSCRTTRATENTQMNSANLRMILAIVTSQAAPSSADSSSASCENSCELRSPVSSLASDLATQALCTDGSADTPAPVMQLPMSYADIWSPSQSVLDPTTLFVPTVDTHHAATLRGEMGQLVNFGARRAYAKS